MSFILISYLIIVLSVVGSIHQHFILKQSHKEKWLHRLHTAGFIAGAYLFIQYTNPAVFFTAATALTLTVILLDKLRTKYFPQPSSSDVSILVEISRDCWLFLLILTIIRSLVYDYSPVPSGSMEPTLLAGDLIAINKHVYQLKIPPFDHPLITVSSPKRGDVIVFNPPENPMTFYVKRVIAVGGDTVVYEDKQYTVNGQKLPLSEITTEYMGRDSTNQNNWLTSATEEIDGQKHAIQIDDRHFDKRIEITIPQGHYFVSGDIRDYSRDSRFFGPIPEQCIVGKAEFIITHFSPYTLLNVFRAGRIK